MHWLIQSLRSLARHQPSWTFRVFTSIGIPQMNSLKQGNIEFVYWDASIKNKIFLYLGKQILNLIGKGTETSLILQSQFERFGIKWADTSRIRGQISECDVLWVPFYNISLHSLSLYDHLSDMKVPIVATVHDIHPSFYPEDHSAADLSNYQQAFIPFTRQCQAIITHSEFQKQAIADHLDISTNKIWVTPQPPLIEPEILLKRFSKDEMNQILQIYHIDRPFVFYPASTTYAHKNHARLLLAWSELRGILGNECPLLVCTGKGNRAQWRRISSLIDQLSLNDLVRFTGSIEIHPLTALYQACALVVIPTLYEGAGSGILTDACIAGKTVIANKIPQIQEQLIKLGNPQIEFLNGVNVQSISSTIINSIERLNSHTKIATRNSDLIVNRFDELWETCSMDYSNILENAITYV